MKISTIIFSAAFLGLVTHMGSAVFDPDHPEHFFNNRNKDRDASFRSPGRSSPVYQINARELRELKHKEQAVSKQVREAEIALQKIESSERFLKNRLRDLEKESRRIRESATGREAIRSSELSLCRHLKSLEEEKDAFKGLVEQLKSEHVACKVRINLFGVKAKREMMQKLITTDKRSPIDDLKREEENRCLQSQSDRKSRHTIVSIYQ